MSLSEQHQNVIENRKKNSAKIDIHNALIHIYIE